MNVLDEKISRVQRQLLQDWKVPAHHIGYELGRKGITDDEIIPFLMTLQHPTFFTLDGDFYRPFLCHARSCLIMLDVPRDQSASFVRRCLRHPDFDTQAKRMGSVIRASSNGLFVWRLRAQIEAFIGWGSGPRLR
jgi:hypothetical protein